MTKETVESKKKMHDNLCQNEASLNSYCSAWTLSNILKYFQQGFQERLVNIIITNIIIQYIIQEFDLKSCFFQRWFFLYIFEWPFIKYKSGKGHMLA